MFTNRPNLFAFGVACIIYAALADKPAPINIVSSPK